MASTVLQFSFRNDPAAFGLDDVSVQAIPAPFFQSVGLGAGVVSFTWTALPGLSYQLQCTSDLGSPNWSNLGSAVSATNGIMSGSDVLTSGSQHFYRVLMVGF